MRMIIALLLILSFIFLLFYPIIFVLEPLWYRVIFGKRPNIKLSYEDFMKYYNLAPQKYKIDNIWKHLVVYETQYYSRIYIGFNIIDTYKVVYALKTTKEQEEITKKQEQKNREIKEYLEFVQRDIDNLLNKSEEQINEAKEITNNIINMDYSNCANAAPSHHQLSSAAGNWEIKNGRLIRIE